MTRRPVTTGAVAVMLSIALASCSGSPQGTGQGSTQPTQSERATLPPGQPPGPPGSEDPSSGLPVAPPSPPADLERPAAEGDGTEVDAIGSGTVGGYTSSGAFCLADQMFVGHPLLFASDTYRDLELASGVIGGSQLVAYRAHVAKWDGSKWSIVASDPWRARSVPFASAADQPNSPWYNFDTRRSDDPGASQFVINQNGYYAVWMQYYWYGSQKRDGTSGYTTDWGTTIFEGRDGSNRVLDYCSYG